MSMLGPRHTSNVRILYKSILRLHRGLPLELTAIGDSYVKEEFKRHKNCDVQFIPEFMNEWTKYTHTLAKQLGRITASSKLGLPLNEKTLEEFSEEQITQLFELYQETQKPVDPENPFGDNPLVNKPN